MTSLGLFFVGSVLLINGLSLLGRVNASGAAPVNAFVGALLVAVTAFIVIPVKDLSLGANRDTIVGTVGFLLFAFTYLWVALNNWTGAAGRGWGRTASGRPVSRRFSRRWTSPTLATSVSGCSGCCGPCSSRCSSSSSRCQVAGRALTR